MRSTLGSAAPGTVVVGATGHACAGGSSDAVRLLVHRALREIGAAAADDAERAAQQQRQRSRRAPRPPRLAIVSCLAAGADQLVASEGLRLGYDLDVVLAGRIADTRDAIRVPGDEGVEDAARRDFDALLAERRDLVELGLPLPPGDDATHRTGRRAAYDAATRVAVRSCDLLIAIVDVLHRPDLGASGEAIRTAIRAGRPVVWIDPTRPDRLRWLSHLAEIEFDALAAAPAGARFVPDIEPDSDDPTSETDAPASSDAFVVRTLQRKVASILDAKRRCAEYMAEPLPARRSRGARWAAGLWGSMLERWLPTRLPPGVRESDDPSAGAFARWWRQQRNGYVVAWSVLRDVTRAAIGARRPDRTDAPNGDVPDGMAAGADDAPAGERAVRVVASEVERARRRAAQLAEFYAGAYRSSFLVVAMLGVLAVALASVPAAEAVGAAQASAATPAHPLERTQMLAIAELCVVGIMLGIYYCNRVYRWQEKSINYRLLAERFRHAAPLMLVGCDWTDAAALPAQYRDRQLQKTWVEPCFQRAMNRIDAHVSARLAGTTPAVFDDRPEHANYVAACRRYVLARWLGRQARYHRDAATRYEALSLMLESFQFTLLIFTLLICVLHIVAHLSWLSFFAGVFPAVSGALGSVAGQAEVVRLRDRALSMHRSIERRARELSQPGADPTSDALRRFVEGAAQEMLGEALEWRVLFTFRPMSSPA